MSAPDRTGSGGDLPRGVNAADTLAEVFVSTAPRADDLALFAPLIGSWSLDVFEYDRAGRESRTAAEWHFGWALDGHALADVWISPPRDRRTAESDGEWGLSLRFYDAALGAWRSTWHGPRRGWVIPFVARATGDGGIVLEGSRDGVALRWIFSDLTADTFRWRAEESEPGAEPFVRQRFDAVRTA